VSWKLVRGHDAAVRSFDRVVRQGRLAHAYLFAGPPGIGKRLFAQELAKALLCEAAPSSTLEACDRCAACVQVAAGTHPDLLTASRPAESLELPIDTLRELCRALGLKPARGRRKVAILDDADDLNAESANCFLKTLEEPPPGSLLLLIGTRPERQLPTIVSRCQVIHFRPLAADLVADILRAEGIESARAEQLARLSGGSPGHARALGEPLLWDFRRGLIEALSQDRFDSVTWSAKLIEFVEQAGKEAAEQRRRAALMVSLLIDFLGAALACRVGATPPIVEDEDRAAFERLGAGLDADGLMRLLDFCLEAERQIDRRVQLVLVLEALMDRLSRRSYAGSRPAS